MRSPRACELGRQRGDVIDRPGGGWIEIVCGSMFSGKTEELIRRVRRAKIARQNVQVSTFADLAG